MSIATDDRETLYRRTLVVVVASQVFGGAGLAAGITVGALLAEEMLGTDSLAGLPAALFTLGSALTAFTVGRLSQRSGRRVGLTAGFAAGGLGAAGVVLAAATGNVVLLFVSLFVYGAGTASNLQARYAGTDLALPRQRGTAVSIAMVSTTVGAVAGPNLVEVMGGVATGWGLPALAGPFVLASAAFFLAATILLVFLRPDPLLAARSASASVPVSTTTSATGAAGPSADVATSGPPPARRTMNHGVAAGATVMVVTQIAMAAIMTMTPVHMRDHGHGLGAVGLVISIHVGAMFLPSLVTGLLVDRVGRTPVAVASGVTLLASGVLAALAPADSMVLLTVALALLGLGWNLGLISGTALVIDAADPATRAKTQGTLDVLVALAGAGGGALSGVVVAGSSYAALSLGGGALALLLVPVVVWTDRRARAGRATPVAG
ncbi:MFS transporter [Sanguibacter sp. 25GB23B1]|uniref:MFS transporter n=1 Tax=unclassified Sanguibacter TaxID=2645534 RepID=UPI0032AF5B2A